MTSITEFQNGEDIGGLMIKFKVGKVYTMRSICDHECIWECEVIKRTRKFVTVKPNNQDPVMVKIHTMNGVEFCFPLGSYSMAPVLKADKEKV